MRPPSPPADSGWSSIRPYTPRLQLTVWEITPVSVTLILATSLDPVFLRRPDEGQIAEEEEPRGISDVLKSGLAVKVNAEPWDKVVIHTGEDEEEAIVTICGLLPAVNYVIDLHVAAADEDFHGVITTSSADLPLPGEVVDFVLVLRSDRPLVLDEVESDLSVSMPRQTATPESTPPSSPVYRTPSSPPASASTSSLGSHVMTVEERVAQLQVTLAATLAERDAISAQLRTAKRDSQRVDSTLRSEIDALKRASEKNAQTELRTKRKIASAQKVVEQLNTASEEAEALIHKLTAEIPTLEGRAVSMLDEHARVKDEAERSAAEAEEAIKGDKKRAVDLDDELADLTAKLEVVEREKGKLKDDTIPELERQLAQLHKEIEAVENGSSISLPPVEFNHEMDYPHHYHQNPFPQPPFNGPVRGQPPVAGAGSRRPPPIQRPPQNLQPPMISAAFSTSQRSLEDGSRPPPGGQFYPHNASTGAFPQIRHPSVNAHPPPRGLFSSNSRPPVVHGNPGPSMRRSGAGSSSSLNTRGGLGGSDPFVAPGSGLTGSGAAPGYPIHPGSGVNSGNSNLSNLSLTVPVPPHINKSGEVIP